MAKRKNKQPETITKLWFNFSVDEKEAFGQQYIDLNQCLSQVMRKKFHQGYNVLVKNVHFTVENEGQETTAISINTLAQNWQVMNSIRKGFEEWKDQRQAVLSETGMKGRYGQFLVGMDDAHYFNNNLLPYAGNYLGEWAQSDYVFSEDGSQPRSQALYVMGDYRKQNVPALDWAVDNDGLSLIKAYQDSRGLVLTPDPTLPAGDTPEEFSQTAPWVHASMLNLGDVAEEVQEDLIEQGDMPPYAIEPQFNDLQLEYVVGITNYGDTNALLTGTSGAFAAPLGLIKLQSNFINNTESNINFGVCVELCMGRGQHGVMMEAML